MFDTEFSTNRGVGTTRHGILLRPARVYGLIRNNIFNYGCVNNNYGNVQVYEASAGGLGERDDGWEVGCGGWRDSQSYVLCSRISPTAGSVIKGG